MKTFTFIADPGHAWLQVSLDDVYSTSVDKYEFSSFSFIQGETVFLEEDVDACLFLLAYELEHGAGSFRIETRDVADFDRKQTRLPGVYFDFEKTMERCKTMREAIRRRDGR